MICHQIHELSFHDQQQLSWSHCPSTKETLESISDLLAISPDAPISPVTAICSSLNRSNTPTIWFVRSCQMFHETLHLSQITHVSSQICLGGRPHDEVNTSISQPSQQMLLLLHSPLRSIHSQTLCNLV